MQNQILSEQEWTLLDSGGAPPIIWRQGSFICWTIRFWKHR